MDLDDPRTIAQRLRQIRHARGKSLRVISGLAGISKSALSQMERGERPLDSLAEIVALANALQVAPSELIRAPLPAPANGPTDSAVEAVRSALMAVNRARPGGQVVLLDALRARVTATLAAHYSCRQDREVGAALPELIRDLHTSITAGRDVAQLLELAMLLHVGVTVGWLRVAGAPLDLRTQAAHLAHQAAQHRDSPVALGLATWGGLHLMLASGEFDLAQAELDSVTVPTNTPESTQLAGMLALCQSLVAAADSRPSDIAAPLEYASELAERTGEGNAYWMGFGPTNVGFWRMNVALEAGDHQRAVAIAEGLHPEAHPFRGCQAMYWVDYGRALARLRGRHDDAVRAFRQAERISPRRVHRNPYAREVLAGLLARTRPHSPAGRELRRMAYRAGLPV
ncbi:MAG: helix-turn-helix domain-containing protein [Actinomycetota bacterium]|nr:helix-turn-helix domain-containing protein [Actinomycetota bacterium]